MLSNAPLWARDVMIFGILALLVGLGLIILGNIRRSRAEQDESDG